VSTSQAPGTYLVSWVERAGDGTSEHLISIERIAEDATTGA